MTNIMITPILPPETTPRQQEEKPKKTISKFQHELNEASAKYKVPPVPVTER